MPSLDKTLADLAAKLGTTVEHLWPVYVRYIWVDSVICTAFGVGLTLLSAWMIRFAYRSDWYEEPKMAVFIIFGLASVVGVLLTFSLMAGVFSPEGAAVHSLMRRK